MKVNSTKFFFNSNAAWPKQTDTCGSNQEQLGLYKCVCVQFVVVVVVKQTDKQVNLTSVRCNYKNTNWMERTTAVWVALVN